MVTAYQEVGQGVPEGGQAGFTQKCRVVNLVDAHVGTLRKVFSVPHSHVGASFGNYLFFLCVNARHGTDDTG